MRFNYVFFGLIVGVVAGYYLGIVATEQILDTVKSNLGFLVAVILIFLAIIITIYVFHEKFLKFILGANKTQVSEVIKDITIAVEKVSPSWSGKVTDPITIGTRNLAAIYAAWATRMMIFRSLVGIAVALGGTLATYVLIKQNDILDQQTGLLTKQDTRLSRQNSLIGKQSDLLKEQNKLLRDQNKLVDSQDQNLKLQSLIQDASRFSVFSPLVSEIIKDINLEAQTRREERQLKWDSGNSDETEDSELYKLSKELVAQIKAVLSQLEPYSYVDSSKIKSENFKLDINNTVFLSPERGKIFMALFTNEIDLSSMEGANFSYADLRNKDFQGLEFKDFNYEQPIACGSKKYDFTGVNLKSSDFSGSTFGWVLLNHQQDMNLDNTTFEQSKFIFSKNKNIDFRKINFDQTSIELGNDIWKPEVIHLNGLSFFTDEHYLDKPCITLAPDNDVLTTESNKNSFPKNFMIISDMAFNIYGYTDDISRTENHIFKQILELATKANDGDIEATRTIIEKLFRLPKNASEIGITFEDIIFEEFQKLQFFVKEVNNDDFSTIWIKIRTIDE